jgi:hypothetical protein
MNKMMVLLLLVALAITGCAGLTAREKGALVGGSGGAAAGALFGAAAGGAAVGAAIGGIVGATAGTLYGLNEANTGDARAVEAYRACMRKRGYASAG